MDRVEVQLKPQIEHLQRGRKDDVDRHSDGHCVAFAGLLPVECGAVVDVRLIEEVVEILVVSRDRAALTGFVY